eukprot:CAMPEP_0198291592 /NCGR_PEP_ID=MMETSP1449-20131203/9074_1 /TAXON_ID=420275 /ORGANISM="Attheya septentrionalis, Strain CCMP2084" /LENGTH=571 /DNA_ID=CAMNT_0043990257 /DNA_START=283 /DNA_END=1995 /DNA_ORIENTATION=+
MSSGKPAIVWTIAGSDSGGGAGIQADLHAIHAFGCHGCSAVTCLTAQNSQGVSGVHAPPPEFLRLQLASLMEDLSPRAVKIGMLGTAALAQEVGAFLKQLKLQSSLDNKVNKPWVVVDPVMISTSGHKLIDDETVEAMMKHVFPFADVLTPNKFEAEALLGRTLTTPQQVEEGARELLDKCGVPAILLKGGHSLAETNPQILLLDQDGGDSGCVDVDVDVNATMGYAQDYFLSRDVREEERLCDGGVWLRSDRYDSENTHGTGCTLSSAMASALALGHEAQENSLSSTGATIAMTPIDAACLAKAYVATGIARGVQLGKGPGPVVHTGFPSTDRHFPTIVLDPTSQKPVAFRPMHAASSTQPVEDSVCLGKILPIVETVDWVERLARVEGVTDIQLRIKDTSNIEEIRQRVEQAQATCTKVGVRLWINDYWEAAVAAKCFGVHVGQEDLAKCFKANGLEVLQKEGLALGISTHSFAELSAALGIRPSYISLGPVFGTTSKNVAFDPQGLKTVRKWRQLIPPGIPLVAIGGINNAEIAEEVKKAGAECVAVIGAITKSDDVPTAVANLNHAM